MLLGSHGYPEYRQRYPGWGDELRLCLGCGKHVPEVRILLLSHLTLTIVSDTPFSPRPTPELSNAVDQNPQAHDCVQVRCRNMVSNG